MVKMGRSSGTMLLISVLVYCFLAFTSATTTAPLLIWTKEPSASRCNEQFTPSTLQTAGTLFNDELMACILGEHAPTKAVLFLQNGLSVDTLRHVFGSNMDTDSLQKLRKHLESSVAIPAFQFDEVPEKSFSALKGNFEFEVVYLPDELEAAANMIQNKLNSEQGNVICLWTTADAAEDISLKRNRRDVANIKNDTDHYCFAKECIAICLSDITFKREGDSSPSVWTVGDAPEVNCTDETTSTLDVNLKAKIPSGVDSLKLRLTFSLDLYPVSAMQWWTVKTATASYVQSNVTTAVSFFRRSFRSLTAPRHWSFACSQPPMLYSKADKSKKSEFVTLQFENLQLQPFDGQDGFSDAVDCSSWVTAPLVLSLLITLFIIIMMAYGLSMITSITTMDRFDDPKGKGISVPQDT